MAVTLGTYDRDAARHFYVAFDPLSAVLLQIGVTGFAPCVPEIMFIFWREGNKPGCFGRCATNDVGADECDGLKPMLRAVAIFVVHVHGFGHMQSIVTASDLNG